MRRLLVLLVAILAAWLGTAATAMAATQGTSDFEPIHVYTYNGDDSLQATGTAQRGPPTHTHAINTTDDRWSRGPSARPETDDAVAGTIYAIVETAVRDTENAATTREQVRRSNRESSPLSSAGVAANGGAASVRLGQAGENAVRGVYDIGPKASAEIGGRTRIFDGLTDSAVSEVKNVASQSLTLQLRDSLSYAQSTGRTFNLYVRQDTYLTGPLRDAIARGDIGLRFIP